MLSHVLRSAGRRVRERSCRPPPKRGGRKTERAFLLYDFAAAAVAFPRCCCLATPFPRFLQRKRALCRLDRVAASSFGDLAGRTKKERVPRVPTVGCPVFAFKGEAPIVAIESVLSSRFVRRCFSPLATPRPTSQRVLCDVLQLWTKRGGQGERRVSAQACLKTNPALFFFFLVDDGALTRPFLFFSFL